MQLAISSSMSLRLSRSLHVVVATFALVAGHRVLAEEQVDAKVPPAAESAELGPMPSTLDGQFVRFELTDGQSLRAKVIAETADHYELELASGARMTLPKQSVEKLVRQRGAAARNGIVWFEDPNRTRYFYGPSAMMLKKGQSYFSQKELLFSSVAYGITDYLNIQAGTVVPALFLGTSGINGIIGIKAGGQVDEWLHVAAGAQVLGVPALGDGYAFGAGFFFGTATIGAPDQHFSLSVGKPFFASSTGVASGDSFIATLSGNTRITENVALMNENWLLIPTFARSTPQFISAHAIGARVMGEHVAADVGFIWSFTEAGLVTAIPLPWVDFTYNFDVPQPSI